MKRRTRIIAGASIVLAPLTWGIVDQLRMAAEPPGDPGMVDPEYGVEAVAARLADLQANPGPFAAAAWLEYLSVFLAIIALVAIWRLSVGRSPRWAWAGLTLAALGVFGRVVHLTAYLALSQVAAVQEDLNAAATLFVAADRHPFFIALFVPFLIGMLAVIPQLVGLRRARVVPLWTVVAVVGATGLALAVGSQVWSSALYTMLIVAAFSPAALATLRQDEPQAAIPAPRAPAAAAT